MNLNLQKVRIHESESPRSQRFAGFMGFMGRFSAGVTVNLSYTHCRHSGVILVPKHSQSSGKWWQGIQFQKSTLKNCPTPGCPMSVTDAVTAMAPSVGRHRSRISGTHRAQATATDRQDCRHGQGQGACKAGVVARGGFAAHPEKASRPRAPQ